MMRRLFLIRHGETALNASGHFVSSSNPGVSPRGETQIESLSRALMETEIDLISTSPMLRCRQTMEGISNLQKNVAVSVDDRLVELGFGELEGLDADSIESRGMTSTFRAWRQGYPVQYPKGAETFDEAADRIVPVMREIVSGGYSTAVIIGHSHSLRILLAAEVLSVAPEVHRKLRLEHARINEIQWEGDTARLVSLNATFPLPVKP